VSGRDQRHVVVPTTEAAALEVVKTKAVFELAVVVLDAPAQLGQPDQLLKRVSSGRLASQYLTGWGWSGATRPAASAPELPAGDGAAQLHPGRTDPQGHKPRAQLAAGPSGQATVLTAAGPAAVTSSASEDR
jgi:hypothetical protein